MAKEIESDFKNAWIQRICTLSKNHKIPLDILQGAVINLDSYGTAMKKYVLEIMDAIWESNILYDGNQVVSLGHPTLNDTIRLVGDDEKVDISEVIEVAEREFGADWW